MVIAETGITFNGIPIEFLTIKDLQYFANFMHIKMDCDQDDRESMIAIIDNAFLRIKNKNVTDPYYCLIVVYNVIETGKLNHLTMKI